MGRTLPEELIALIRQRSNVLRQRVVGYPRTKTTLYASQRTRLTFAIFFQRRIRERIETSCCCVGSNLLVPSVRVELCKPGAKCSKLVGRE